VNSPHMDLIQLGARSGHIWRRSSAEALWQSEFLCKMGLYRAAIILLADVSLQFGMSRRARKILEEIMPQVLEDFFDRETNSHTKPQLIEETDLEQRAVACFTLARCIIAAGSSKRS
jgi:hypothetical protein